MDTGGVLVWKGQGGWNRRPDVLLMGTAAGLNSRRDADSRLLRSSAFWENKSWSQFKSSSECKKMKSITISDQFTF